MPNLAVHIEMTEILRKLYAIKSKAVRKSALPQLQ